MGTSAPESRLKITAHYTTFTTQAAVPHSIVVALQFAETSFRKLQTTVFGTSFVAAGDDEEDGLPLFRVACMEARLALMFSHGYQGCLPMLPMIEKALWLP